MAGRRPSEASMTQSLTLDNDIAKAEDTNQAIDGIADDQPASEVKAAEKFFIVKSLTLQDLEQSARNGIWATQSHNEQILNKAFKVGVKSL
jgi:hypothetical protein